MFKWEETTDSYGQPQTEYWLTQGDSCEVYYTPMADGVELDTSLISKVTFRLGDSDYNLVFEKELVLSGDKYLLALTSEETSELEVENYKYEVEYTFVDKDVQTPHQSDWHITQQIKPKGV